MSIQSEKNQAAIIAEAMINFSNPYQVLNELEQANEIGRICNESSCEREAIDRMYHKIHVIGFLR